MSKIFLIFLKIIVSLANVILYPVNRLIRIDFPDINNLVYSFNSIIDTYIGSSISYFSSILPPMTRNVLFFYFSVLIWGYGIVYSIHLFVKVFHIIKNIKFW